MVIRKTEMIIELILIGMILFMKCSVDLNKLWLVKIVVWLGKELSKHR